MEGLLEASHDFDSSMKSAPSGNHSSLTTVCAYCKRVRDADDTWAVSMSAVDLLHVFIGEASHGICPACLSEHFSDFNAAPVASLHARQECGENPASTGEARSFHLKTVQTSIAPGVTVALGAEGEA